MKHTFSNIFIVVWWSAVKRTTNIFSEVLANIDTINLSSVDYCKSREQKWNLSQYYTITKNDLYCSHKLLSWKTDAIIATEFTVNISRGNRHWSILPVTRLVLYVFVIPILASPLVL